ncbi:MAG: polysaccharide deacetylase family protein [Saprospiraceae bacterium]|nr:polysaccharide deacetylase family protein [Saprospiraceae bacterium]
MYLVRTPELIQNLFPNFIWRIPTTEKKLFLTFDDGPIPEVTPWVLKELSLRQAKATFFCVGENVERNPKIFQQLRKDGHTVANHTNNHLSGWRTENIPYFHNVRRGANLVKSPIFRPPYGKIKPSQVPFLMRHYHIIMWDVLSGDFDPKITEEQCYRNVVDNTQPGSIIVFHDSIKSENKLRYTLPKVLDYFTALGFKFEALTEELIEVSDQFRQRA